jgi:hypothetical protein
MTLEVQHYHGAARHLPHPRKQLRGLRVLKMMQKQRTDDEIEAPRLEWQKERIAGDSLPASRLKMQFPAVERRQDGVPITSPKRRAHIAGGRADIQDSETLVARNQGPHQATQNSMAAE